MKTKSISDNRSVIILLAAAGIAGFLFFLAQYRTAFPAASIDLKLSKQQVLDRAQTWSQRLGYKQEKLIRTIEFDADNEAKIFLEYNLGGQAANDLMRSRIPVWSWDCRFCREFDQERVQVDLSPDGKLVALGYDIANDRAIPDLSHEQARQIAFKFINEEAGLSTAGLRPVNDSETEQVHRHDHRFVWEDDSSEWQGAKLRVAVSVSGNKVTDFSHYLHVPEEWGRKYATMRSYNQLLSQVAHGLSFIFVAWAAYLFLRSCALHRVRWRFAMVVAGLAAVVMTGSSMNELPAALHAYEPTTSLSNFLISFFGGCLTAGASAFIMFAILLGAAEAQYRAGWGKHMALEWTLKVRGWQAPELLRNILLGYLLFAVVLGYQVAYYMLGKHLGYWCPLDVGNFQVLSGQFPVLSAVNIGVRATLLEECLFRVVGLSLCQKLFKNFWVANVIQALVWGFCHSDYPQQPPFARGVELTIFGILSGWILKRFGLPALLLQHYLFDAFLGSQPLYMAPGIFEKLTGVLAIAPPAIAGICFAVFGKAAAKKSRDQSLLNEDLLPPAPPEEITEISDQPEESRYQPLPAVARALLALAVAAYVGSDFIPDNRVGSDSQPLRIDRAHAIEIASRYLAEHHYDFAQHRIVAQLSDGLSGERQDLQYVYEKDGLEKTRQLASQTARSLIWNVRFFKPLKPEEFSVRLDGQGDVLSIDVYEPEFAQGAKLSREQAQLLAVNFVRSTHPEFCPFNLADVHEKKLQNRTDHHFEFEVPKLKVADAQYRIETSVVGNRASGFGYYWDLPDQWRFEKRKEGHSTVNTIAYVLSSLAGLACGLAVIWWAVAVVRGTRLWWRAACLLGLLAAILRVVEVINHLPVAFAYYHTTMPWSNFLSMIGFSDAAGVFQTFLVSALCAILGLPAARLVLGGRPLLKQLKQAFAPDSLHGKEDQHKMWLDGILLAFGYYCTVFCVGILWRILDGKIGHDVPIQSFSVTSAVASSLSGWLQCLLDSSSGVMFWALVTPIVCALYQEYCRGIKRFACLVLLAALLAVGRAVTWQDGLLTAGSTITAAFLTWFFIAKLARRNIAAYIAYAWISVPLAMLFALGRYGLPLFAGDYFAITAILSVPLAYLLYVQIGWRYAAKAAKLAAESSPVAT